MLKCEQRFLFYFSLGCTKIFAVLTKGEVEDIRLEAKAKPRTQKKSEAKTKDSPTEDRLSRGKGQECSRPTPRTQRRSDLKKKDLCYNIS